MTVTNRLPKTQDYENTNYFQIPWSQVLPLKAILILTEDADGEEDSLTLLKVSKTTALDGECNRIVLLPDDIVWMNFAEHERTAL